MYDIFVIFYFYFYFYLLAILYWKRLLKIGKKGHIYI